MKGSEGLKGDLLDLKVEELLASWPTAAQVFVAYRMACLGCAFAHFHTTREALRVYRLETKPFLHDLLAAIEQGAGRPYPMNEKETSENA